MYTQQVVGWAESRAAVCVEGGGGESPSLCVLSLSLYPTMAVPAQTVAAQQVRRPVSGVYS